MMGGGLASGIQERVGGNGGKFTDAEFVVSMQIEYNYEDGQKNICLPFSHVLIMNPIETVGTPNYLV